MINILFGLFIAVIAFYLYLTWNFDYWKRRGVAGPTPRPYVGTFPKTAMFDKNTNYIQETTEIFRKYFRKHRFVGVFEHRTPKLLILDPALATDILVKYFKNFGDNSFSDMIDASTDPLFKPNPFIERLAKWKERRVELQPAFSALKVRAIYPAIEHANRQLEHFLTNRIASGQDVFRSKEICSRVIADIICNVIFGLEAKAFDDDSEFLKRALGILYSTPFENIRMALYLVFPWLHKIYPHRLTSDEFTTWMKGLYDHAAQLRKETNVSRDDYLNFLIELQNKKNTPIDLIHAYAFTLFLDGFETTSYMLGKAINYLAENKECQEKLRTEIKDYDNISYEELHRLPYLDAVFNETLRLSPFPFPIWKTCTESIEFTDYDGSTLLVEKGTKLILPMNALHSHPDFYGNPNKFDPERFDESTGGVKRLKDASVFIPFGNGPRICIGMRFATAEIKAALFNLFGKFEVSLEPNDEPPSSPIGMLFFSQNTAKIRVKCL